MNICLKTVDNMMIRFKEVCAEDIIRKVETQDDKIDAMQLIYKHQLYPLYEFIKLPHEFDAFIDAEMGLCYDRYMIMHPICLLESIDNFLYEHQTGFDYEKEKIGKRFLHFPEEWYEWSKEEIYSKCIDILYQFMLDNKISGCIMDW